MAKVVVLSGAGISAESGISTFRDSDGLWENHDVKVICNYDSMQKHESKTIGFYDMLRTGLETKEPNQAHKVLAELKHQYPEDIAIITQNIDDLFEKAGLSEDELIHLHGFLPELRCQECATLYNISYKETYDFNNGYCKECDGKLRPNIVFFGEQAPKYEDLNRELNDCEMFVVIGTSGNVIGVNHIASAVDIAILNNLEPSYAIEERFFSKVIYDKASVAIDEIADIIEEYIDNK
jgi:NAD-dependent deacetylase